MKITLECIEKKLSEDVLLPFSFYDFNKSKLTIDDLLNQKLNSIENEYSIKFKLISSKYEVLRYEIIGDINKSLLSKISKNILLFIHKNNHVYDDSCGVIKKMNKNDIDSLVKNLNDASSDEIRIKFINEFFDVVDYEDENTMQLLRDSKIHEKYKHLFDRYLNYTDDFE